MVDGRLFLVLGEDRVELGPILAAHLGLELIAGSALVTERVVPGKRPAGECGAAWPGPGFVFCLRSFPHSGPHLGLVEDASKMGPVWWV